MRIQDAKKLTRGTVIFSIKFLNADGTPQRWRVNGMVKTWKRDPSRVKVPIMYGLRCGDYLTEDNAECYSLSEGCAARGQHLAPTIPTLEGQTIVVKNGDAVLAQDPKTLKELRGLYDG